MSSSSWLIEKRDSTSNCKPEAAELKDILDSNQHCFLIERFIGGTKADDTEKTWPGGKKSLL